MTGRVVPTVIIPLLALLATEPCAAQARTVSAPADDYLLEITQEWGARSALGDLRLRAMGPHDIELRLWGGYGLAGTYGTVLRRTDGRWSGWLAITHRCSVWLPLATGDTLSEASIRRYQAQARGDCSNAPGDILPARVIYTDSLGIRSLPGDPDLETAWRDAVAAGVSTLPGEVPRSWVRLDGHTYVVELRTGDEYRASVIEHTDPPATDADRKVQDLYRAVHRRLGLAR